MASPGVFIHSATLGGRLSALSLAPSAWLPARPPAMTAPPTNAPPSRRNRRRDVAAISLSMSDGSVIVHPPFESDAKNNAMKPSRHFKGRHHQPANISALPGRAANHAAEIVAPE